VSIKEIAEQVQSAVRLADALGKPQTEVRDAVRKVVDGLPIADLKAVEAQIAESVTNDHR
jgi:hypothetical protein